MSAGSETSTGTSSGHVPGSWSGKWPYLVGALGVVLLDQVTKYLVVKSIPMGGTVEVIPGLFRLELWLNPGGVWGLGREVGQAARIALFMVLPIVVTGVAVWYAWEAPRSARLRLASIAVVLGGAVGNLVDRVRLGKVVDFLVFHVKEHTWPAFNVADSAICVGVALLMGCVFLEREDGGAPRTLAGGG